jgi:hypothetical protein
MSRKRGYDIPGQDRLPQSVNRVSQAVNAGSDSYVLSLRYMIDGRSSDTGGFCGAFIRVEGFRGPYRKLNMVYSAGMGYHKLDGEYSPDGFPRLLHYALEDGPGKWQQLTANLQADHDRMADGERYDELGLEKLVISLGTWTINDGGEYPYAIWVDHIRLGSVGPGSAVSRINGRAVENKPQEKIWWRGKHMPSVNIGGEHRYHLGTWKK